MNAFLTSSDQLAIYGSTLWGTCRILGGDDKTVRVNRSIMRGVNFELDSDDVKLAMND